MNTKIRWISKFTLCLVTAVLATHVQAASEATEDFEGFTLTDLDNVPASGWNPSKATDGWTAYGEVFQQGRTPNFFAIAEGSDPINTSQVLLIDSSVADSPGENMYVHWYPGAFPDAAATTTKTTIEWFPVELFVGDQHRFSMSRGGSAPDNTWTIEWNAGNGFYGPLQPAPSGVIFTTGDCAGCDLYENNTIIPGTNTGDPNLFVGTWWVTEIEEDNVDNKTRARAYPKGSTPNAWTDWIPHTPDANYTTDSSWVRVFCNGRCEVDNYKIESIGGSVGPACDLDLNAACDATDIDLMAAAVRNGTVDSKFNVDGLGDPNIPDDNDYEFLITDATMFATGHGDADLNKVVNFNDFVSLSNNFGTSDTGWATGNFNTDTTTNFNDFVRLSNNFSTTFVSGANVPEPAAIGVLGVLALTLLRKRQ